MGFCSLCRDHPLAGLVQGNESAEPRSPGFPSISTTIYLGVGVAGSLRPRSEIGLGSHNECVGAGWGWREPPAQFGVMPGPCDPRHMAETHFRAGPSSGYEAGGPSAFLPAQEFRQSSVLHTHSKIWAQGRSISTLEKRCLLQQAAQQREAQGRGALRTGLTSALMPEGSEPRVPHP